MTPEQLKKDFEKIKLSAESDYTDSSYDLKSYFEPGDQYIAPLANNHGQIALNEYVEYTHGEIFCPDWIKCDGDKDKADERQALADGLAERLNLSNFYEESLKLVKEGAIYNRGILQTQYDGGLSFNTIKNESIYTSKCFNPLKRRAYAEQWISLKDLIDTFKGPVVDEYDTMLTNMNDEMEYSYMQVMMVTCIIPLKKGEDDKDIAKGYRFKQRILIMKDDVPYEVTPLESDNLMYKTFPLMHYAPQLDISLAALALTKAVKADEYEILMARQARKSQDPSIAIAKTTYLNNSFDLSEGGLVPLAPNERMPQPIESSQSMNLTSQDIQRHQIAIDRVFKIDLIQRAKITNLSQFEAAANYLNALKAIAPSAVDLVRKLPGDVLERAHSLLMQNDKEYAKLADAAGDIKWGMSGWNSKIKHLEKATGLGRLAQGIVPFIQIDPSAAQAMDGDAAVRVLAESWGVSEVVPSEEEVAAEREAQQQAQQQAMEQQQQSEQAAIDKTQAEADAIRQGGQ